MSKEEINAFESLFVNNESLDMVRRHLSRFNPIKTMGMGHMEIRHSALLGWLLSPQETHGLGDSFLKAFLSEALRGHDSEIEMSPSALEVSQANMMDAEVRREWRHIDLLIMSPRNGWVFIIENKFNSSQHGNQLKRYMDGDASSLIDGDTYRDLRGIFLTLWEEEPKDPRYAPIEYATICQLLRQIALSGRVPLTQEVEQFLKHYLDVIEETTGMSDKQEKMEKLARQLYLDHRQVIDFIVEHGKRTDFIIACESIFGENLKPGSDIKLGDQKFIFHRSGSNTFSFLPLSWHEALGGKKFSWKGCENWWAGFPIIMWLQLISDSDSSKGKIRLYAEIGPLSDHDFRHELIEGIKDTASNNNLERIAFQRGASDEGKKYSKFLKRNSFSVDDVQDHDQIVNAIKKALTRFQSEIDAIAPVLEKFINHGYEDD